MVSFSMISLYKIKLCPWIQAVIWSDSQQTFLTTRHYLLLNPWCKTLSLSELKYYRYRLKNVRDKHLSNKQVSKQYQQTNNK